MPACIEMVSPFAVNHDKADSTPITQLEYGSLLIQYECVIIYWLFGETSLSMREKFHLQYLLVYSIQLFLDSVH